MTSNASRRPERQASTSAVSSRSPNATSAGAPPATDRAFSPSTTGSAARSRHARFALGCHVPGIDHARDCAIWPSTFGLDQPPLLKVKPKSGQRAAVVISSVRLTFAFLLRIVLCRTQEREGRRRTYHASTHQTAARDSRLPERVHPAARVCPEPGGNRPALRPLFARDGAQTSDQPAGKRVHQARLESQPFGRDGADADRRARSGATAARVC